MDPQQRVLLETVYEGVESTGYSMRQLRGLSTAVFVGCMSYDYQFTAIRGIDGLPQYHATGTSASILANRVSYFLTGKDHRSPSIRLVRLVWSLYTRQCLRFEMGKPKWRSRQVQIL